MSRRSLSSGEVANEAGVNLETLRYYERRGLLPQPPRTANGHRRYGPETVSLLALIKRARELGFTLSEIGELLEGLGRPRAVCDDVCKVIEAKIDRLDQELATLRSLRARLSRLRVACPRTRLLRECPVVVELQQTRNPRRRRP